MSDEDQSGEWVRVVDGYVDFDDVTILTIGEKYRLAPNPPWVNESQAEVSTIWMGMYQIAFPTWHFERVKKEVEYLKDYGRF